MHSRTIWPVVKLSRIFASPLLNGAHQKDMQYGTGTKIVRMVDLYRGDYIDLNSLDRVTYNKPLSNNFILKDGDVLINRTSLKREGVAKASLLSGACEDIFFDCSIIRVRPDSGKVDSQYLLFALNSPDLREQIMKVAKTATITTIAQPDIENLEIPLPPLDEQRRIAAIFDKADAIRRKRQESIRLTEEFLRSTFLEMFGDPVTNPKGWNVFRIKEVCTEIVDCVNRTAQTVDYPTPYKMIRTTNVRNYSIDLKEVRYVDEQVFNQWTRRLLPRRGDIVFTREAPAGEAGIIESDDNVFLGQRTMHFRPDMRQTTSEYLLFELMGSSISRQIEIMSAGSTVKHLSVPECKEFQVRVPPIEMQKKFSAIVSCAKDAKGKQCSAFDSSELLFTSSAHRAFRGEL